MRLLLATLAIIAIILLPFALEDLTKREARRLAWQQRRLAVRQWLKKNSLSK